MVVQEQPIQVSLAVQQVGHYWVKLYANDEPVAQRALPILLHVPGDVMCACVLGGPCNGKTVC
jgi:hypothetical protein